MKHLKKYLFPLLLIVAALPVFADSATIGGIEYYCDNETGKAIIHKWHDCRGVITIPESISLNEDKYIITEIGDEAFSDCKSISSVSIPESIVKIGKRAFSGCSGMVSVSIPKSMEQIGVDAFDGCTGLNWVYISDLEAWCDITFESSGSNPLKFARDLYLEGKLISDLKIPDSVTIIKNYTFTGSYISTVDFHTSIREIGIGAFSDCVCLTDVTIPESVRRISEYAFSGCTSLENVHISDLETWCNIEFGFSSNPLKYARKFYLNGELVTDLIIPGGMKRIGGHAFEGFGGLNSVKILNSTIEISTSAFTDCNGLTSVTIPGLRKFGNLFKGCGNLQKLTISYFSKEIEDSAFQDWTTLTSVTIPGSVTKIGNAAFKGCSKLSSIKIPDSVTEIGMSAFQGCRVLGSIEVPDSATEIKASTFEGCVYLLSVTIPKSVERIGENAFLDCPYINEVYISDLEAWCNIKFEAFSNPLRNVGRFYLNGELISELIIPEGIEQIGNYVFEGYKGLKSLTIPESVTGIGISAFKGCTGLTSLTIPETVIGIGPSAFEGCTSLNSLIFGGNAIVRNTFEDCSHLRSGTLLDSVVEIENCAFLNCSGLKTVNFGNSIKNIGAHAFEGCVNLDSIESPGSIADIGVGAFKNCRKLSKVELGDSSNTVGPNAFENCTGLLSVTVGNSVSSMGNGAFSGCTSLKEVHISDLGAWCNISFGDSDSNPLHFAHNLFLDDELVTDLRLRDGIKQIKDYTFQGCSNLTSVTIPNSVVSIGGYAFSGCNGINSVSIGNSVNYIGAYAFYGCGIKDLTCNAIKPPSCGIFTVDYDYRDYPPDFDFDSFRYSPFGCCSGGYDIPLYVPAVSLDVYRRTYVWRNFKNIMPIGTTSVREISDTDDSVTVTGNTISVDAKAGTPVDIYSIDGVLRYKGSGPAEVELPAGLYILRIGNLSRRIRI